MRGAELRSRTLRTLGHRLLGAAALMIGIAAGLLRDEPADARRWRDAQRARGHETTDARPWPIVGVGLGLVLGLAALGVALAWFQVWLTGVPVAVRPPRAGVADPPEMSRWQLEPRSGQERRAVRAAENQRLASYGWVDQQRSIVHLPIERAMDLLLSQGLPTGPETAATPPVARPSASGRFVDERPR